MQNRKQVQNCKRVQNCLRTSLTNFSPAQTSPLHKPLTCTNFFPAQTSPLRRFDLLEWKRASLDGKRNVIKTSPKNKIAFDKHDLVCPKAPVDLCTSIPRDHWLAHLAACKRPDCFRIGSLLRAAADATKAIDDCEVMKIQHELESSSEESEEETQHELEEEEETMIQHELESSSEEESEEETKIQHELESEEESEEEIPVSSDDE